MGFPFVDLQAFPTHKLHDTLGFNLVFPVLPLHGPRRVGFQSGDRFLDGDCVETIHAEAQSIWDLRRILSWIRCESASAIGVYGLSLGGYNAALLATLERDLSCVIAGIPAVDFLSLGRMHTPAKSITCAEECGVEWPRMADILRVISPLAMPPLIPKSRLFIFGGSADIIVPPDQPRSLWNHWGKPRIAWYPGGHFSFRWESSVHRLLRDALASSMPDAGESSQAA